MEHLDDNNGHETAKKNGRQRPRIIALANQKGGVGKTTTAINLAVCLAIAKRACLLVDLDPQGNASSGLGVEPAPRAGTHAALVSPEKVTDAIVQSELECLDVLPAHPSLVELNRELHDAHDRERRLSMAIEHLTTPYEYILIDCPPSLGLFPANAFSCCDSVLIPIQCEFYAMEGLAQILTNVKKFRRSNPKITIEGILLTMFERDSQYGQEVADEVRGHFGDLVYESVIPRDVALSEAPSHGQGILTYNPRSRGARGYVELTRELLLGQNSDPIAEETNDNG